MNSSYPQRLFPLKQSPQTTENASPASAGEAFFRFRGLLKT